MGRRVSVAGVQDSLLVTGRAQCVTRLSSTRHQHSSESQLVPLVTMTRRTVLGTAALIVLVSCQTFAKPSVIPAEDGATIDCATAIDVLDDLPSDYTAFLDTVALAGSRDSPALPVNLNEETGIFGAKIGLAVRSGSAFTLSISEASRDNATFGWGGSGDTSRLSIGACESPYAWLVFPGGFSVLEPSCVEVLVQHGTRSEVGSIGVGAPCDGQSPPAD